MPKFLTDDEIEAFRERLCDVAEQLFAAHRPEGVTMRQLSDAVGVSVMTPYRYFADKDAILAAVRARAFNRFSEMIESFDAKARRRGPVNPRAMSRAAFRARTDAYLDFALGKPASYRMMFDVYQPTADQYPELVAAIARARRTLVPTSGGGKPSASAAHSAHMLWSAAHGAIMLELAGHLPPPLTARAIARPAAEAIAEKLGILR